MSDDPLSVCCRHLANSQHIIEAKDDEIARLRLTDAEREAIWFFAAIDSNDPVLGSHAATLRGLLERTK